MKNKLMSLGKLIEIYALRIEWIVLLSIIFLSAFVQICIYYFDLSAFFNCDQMNKIYLWIISAKAESLLTVVNGFALIIGGLSFFLKIWTEKDDENIVFILLIVVAVAISYFFKILGWHVMSVAVSLATGILILIPFSLLVFYCLRDSKRRTLKKVSHGE